MSITPDDNERPVTRQEYRAFQLQVAAVFFAMVIAVFCLAALIFITR
ncbi:hypothetical protein ACIQCG_00910 [Streptomyces noursei]